MKTRTRFPRKVRTIHHAVIPLRDGVNLSAMIWLPDDAENDPVPAILEYIPYRKRDGTSDRDAKIHPYFAGHGYASVRVDIRGSGDSEGVLLGEYLKQEQDDALEILAWIAAQPWCTGSIGMIGISWGGFNGLQVAARRPPELKAVVSICSTDDRYADDIHYMGGSLLVDQLSWGSTMFALNATPPDPALVGDNKWRDMWMGRLEKSGFWIEEWHRHQRRDDLYKHGSVCEDWSAIQCPVYAVGGWADGYSNSVFRVVENLQAPVKGLIGPWGHKYPHFAMPGPRIGFLQECIKWWDHWLKGIDTGIMDEPGLRVWMQDSIEAKPHYEERPGRWVAEESWPSARIEGVHYPLAPHKLEKPGAKPQEQLLEICSPQTIGMQAGKWCPYGAMPDQASDQRPEAGGSLVFDSAPLKRPLEIMGTPVAHLDIAADQEAAQVAVTLSEIMPNGSVTRLSYGILNLTHRVGHEDLKPVVPGERYQIVIKLNDCAQKISTGSKIRLAISSAYWPIIWPSPKPVTLSVKTGASALELPVRPMRAEDRRLRKFEPAEVPPDLGLTQVQPPASHIINERDHTSDVHTWEMFSDDGLMRNSETEWTFGSSNRRRYSIRPDDPLSAEATLNWTKEYARGNWSVSISADVYMTVTEDDYVVTAELDAYEGENRTYSNQWNCRIPRDHS